MNDTTTRDDNLEFSGRPHQQTNRLAKQVADRIAAEKRELSVFARFLDDDGLINLQTALNTDNVRVSSDAGDACVCLEFGDFESGIFSWEVDLDTAEGFANRVQYCVDKARGKV